MTTVRALLQESELPRREAELLLEAITGLSRVQMFTRPDADVGTEQTRQFKSFCARRASREPLAYIIGEREFWSLPLRVTPDVLIPRPDTECLVSWANEILIQLTQPACLDLGTGSGAIALAIKSECPSCEVIGVDISAAALEVARLNSRCLELPVEWREGSWFEPVIGRRFPLIVANPPYIPDNDSHLLEGDLPAEPQHALRGGPDGLACLRALADGGQDYLLSGGWLLLEHGWDQGQAVRELLAVAGWVAIETRLDLAGRERVTGARRAHE